MKCSVFRLSLVPAALMLVSVGTARAQSEVEGDKPPTRSGQALYTEAQGSSLSEEPSDRPGLPEQAGLPLMIRERLRLFELKREAYLAEQLDLVRQMRGASNEERKRLREQLREQRQNWLDEAKQIREQARLRLQEMKQELANHSEVLEAARERAREQALEGAEKARERRGTD